MNVALRSDRSAPFAVPLPDASVGGIADDTDSGRITADLRAF
ncbi:hypothetical protein [Nocardia sp. NPDC046763]